jgi:hypothetical protein
MFILTAVPRIIEMQTFLFGIVVIAVTCLQSGKFDDTNTSFWLVSK